MALHAGEPGPAVRLGQGLQIMELIRVHLAGAERAHLAGPDQSVQCLHGLLGGCAVVEAMDDVQVEIVGAEPPERAVDLSLDGLA